MPGSWKFHANVNPPFSMLGIKQEDLPTNLACVDRVMDACGKFGEQERNVRVARGVAESKSSFLRAHYNIKHVISRSHAISKDSRQNQKAHQIISSCLERLWKFVFHIIIRFFATQIWWLLRGGRVKTLWGGECCWLLIHVKIVLFNC